MGIPGQGIFSGAAILPNPSARECRLVFSLGQEETVFACVTDLMGKELWKTSRTGKPGQQSILLPSAQLTPGIYQLRLWSVRQPIPVVLKWMKQ